MAAPIINEFVFNHVGTDTNEFVEILGDPNTNLSNYWLLQIEGDSPASGTIDRATQLGTTDASGLWSTGFLNNAYENGTVTLLLVENFTGAVGNDIDVDNNGVADVLPWTSIVDTVAVTDGGAGDQTYSTTVLNSTFGGGFTPGGASRIPNGTDTDSVSDWMVNDFDLAGIPGFTGTPVAGEALNTPGAVNALAVGGGGGGTPATIAEIQGAGHASTFDGTAVVTSGIVTAVLSNGFYLQDPVGDANIATSEGIFVFTSSAPTVAVGDAVEVEGTVDEFIPGGASTGNLSTTEIVSPSVTVLSSGNPLPAAVLLGAAGRNAPTTVIDDDLLATFDPVNDGIDFYESLEGMRVTIDDALAVSPTNRFGEIFTVADNGVGATGLNGRGGITIDPVDFNPERIQVQLNGTTLPGFDAQVDVGSQLGDVTGVVGYNFGNFEVIATEVFAPSDSALTQETTSLEGTGDRLTVASFNVLNLDPFVEVSSAEVDDDIGSGQFAAIAAQIVDNLKAPDIIALQEVQDNDGGDDTAVTDASLTYQTLIDAIVTAGGPTYEYVDVAPADDSSGGQPGGNIRVGYLYNPSRVDYVDGSAQALSDPNLGDGDAFAIARKPLAADFVFNGETVHVINNHLSSKGGGTPLFGQVQPPVNGSVDQRIAQAQVVNDYVDGLLALDPNAKIVVAGDMNEFDFLEPLDVLKGGADPVLTNLAAALPGAEQYSYIFDGNSQQLDHILVSDALLGSSQFDAVHVNAEFADQASDHDPLLAGFDIPAPSTNYRLQILHASDLEGGVDALGRAANFAAIVDYLEDQETNSITLSAGDNWIPGPFFNAAGDPSVTAALRSVYTQLYGPQANAIVTDFGRADLTMMNIIGFDASALGNHEFDAGTNVMRSILNPTISSGNMTWLGNQFPYLSANLDFSGDANLASLYTSEIRLSTSYDSPPGSSVPAGGFKKIAPATIIEEGGELIGVVGATTPLLEQISSPGATQVKDPGAGTNDMAALATILQPVIDALVAQGVDKIVLVSHLQQIALEKALIQLLHHVDVVIAGGSDTLLADANDDLHPGDTAAGDYPFVTTNADGDPAVIVSTDGEYSYVGRLVLEFDDAGKLDLSSLDPAINGAYDASDDTVEDLWGNLVDPFASGTKGDLASEIIDAVETVVIAKDSVILGKSDVYINGIRAEVRTEETNLGNLTADANLYVAKLHDPTVQVSLKNGGGIRDSIGVIDEVSPGVYEELPPQANPVSGKQDGEVSQLDIENSLRFNNNLSLITVTAEQLLQVVEHGVRATAPGATPGQFPQIGGIAFSFDATRPALDRVLSLALTDENGNVTDVLVEDGVFVGDPNLPIRMVALDFLLTGGDGYPFASFIAANPTFANRVNLRDVGLDAGDATFAAAGTEQDALAEYLLDNFSVTPYGVEDTSPAGDERIQNLAFRADTVLDEVVDIVLTGGNGDDEGSGAAGNDTLDGAGGNDRIAGGGGNDLLLGGSGDDVLFGGNGHDTLLGQGGNDWMFGDSGDDALVGGDGNDVMYGGIGNDNLDGEGGDDQITGDAGNDTMNGGAGLDQLAGGDGDDTISGGANNDLVAGDAGNDTLAGDGGDDIMFGGIGNDQMAGGVGGDHMFGDDGDDDMAGDDGNDVMYGGIGSDTMDGGDGNDMMTGNAGMDVMNGGSGQDQMVGGDDDDQMFGGANDDLVMGDGGNDIVAGDGGNDLLFGGDGNDDLAGGEGSDTLNGGAGDDMLAGGLGLDIFVFDEGSGVDTISDWHTQDLIDLRNLSFASYESVMALSHEEGDDTVIDLNADDGDQLILLGVQLAELQRNDFLI